MKRSKDRQNEPQPPQAGNALVDDAAQRLATIVAAAERAAEQVIDDAETKARGMLADAEQEAQRLSAERLAALNGSADALVAQTEAIRREAERLLAVVAETKASIGDRSQSAAAEPAPARPSHLSAVAPVVDPEEIPAVVEPSEAMESPAVEEPGPPRGSAAGARLLATQMAVSGSSRGEIEARLRSGFEIEDTAAILDAILGPED